VEPGFSSLAAGQYLLAFVRDPEDLPPQDPKEILRWATAQQHSTLAKWWQPSSITVPSNGDNLYTSLKGEARFWSPGKLVVIAVGAPSQPGNMAVWMDWMVHLTEPSSEVLASLEPVEPITASQDLYMVPYPEDTSYACLGTYRSTEFDGTGTFDNTDFAPVNLEAMGFAAHPWDSVFKSSHIATFLGQYKSGDGHWEVPVGVNHWRMAQSVLRQDGARLPGSYKNGPALLPVVVDPKTRSLVDVGYVNGGGIGDWWADTYSYGPVLPEGTTFTLVDLTVDMVAEMRDVMISGRITKRPTGRKLPVKRLTTAEVEARAPLVRIAGSGLTLPPVTFPEVVKVQQTAPVFVQPATDDTVFQVQGQGGAPMGVNISGIGGFTPFVTTNGALVVDVVTPEQGLSSKGPIPVILPPTASMGVHYVSASSDTPFPTQIVPGSSAVPISGHVTATVDNAPGDIVVIVDNDTPVPVSLVADGGVPQVVDVNVVNQQPLDVNVANENPLSTTLVQFATKDGNNYVIPVLTAQGAAIVNGVTGGVNHLTVGGVPGLIDNKGVFHVPTYNTDSQVGVPYTGAFDWVSGYQDSAYQVGLVTKGQGL